MRTGIAKRRTRAGLIAGVWMSLTWAAPSLADTVETSGDVLRVALPMAAYGIAWRRGDDQGRRQFLWAFAGTVASTYALKAAIKKERPNGDDNNAFPSGHTSSAFTGPAFLHRRYGWSDAWPAYVLAAYTGWTRIDSDNHDTWDVLGGAALAIGWNWWLVDPRDAAQPVQIQPVTGAGSVGFRLEGRW